jgi:hypothetical protein
LICMKLGNGKAVALLYLLLGKIDTGLQSTQTPREKTC